MLGPGVRMQVSDEGGSSAAASRVVELLTEALDLIDAHSLAPQVGAYVDLALNLLRGSLPGAAG